MHGAQRRNYAGIATGSGSPPPPPGSGCCRYGSPPAQLVAPGSWALNLTRPVVEKICGPNQGKSIGLIKI